MKYIRQLSIIALFVSQYSHSVSANAIALEGNHMDNFERITVIVAKQR
ncbi:MAG: hypothetical protein ACI9LM_001565 [Alteromonadaceae bacterium]|jgi:hypothetical protein